MNKMRIIAVLVLCALAVSAAAPVSAASASVVRSATAEVYANKAEINGIVLEAGRAPNPILLYQRTLYLPLDDNFTAALGISASVEDGTLKIATDREIGKIAGGSAASGLAKQVAVRELGLTVTLDGREMSWRQPILQYQGLHYMPLDWTIATRSFRWEYLETLTTGLVLKVAKSGGPVKLGPVKNSADPTTPVPAPTSAIVHTRQNIAVGGKNIACDVVTVDMKSGNLRAEAVLAGGSIGATAPLDSAARENGAVFAINGTFFDAYNGYKTPSNALVSQGKLLTTGELYGAIGISGTEARIDRVQAIVNGENTGPVFEHVEWYNGAWSGLSLNTPLIHPTDTRIVIYDRNYQKEIRAYNGFIGYYFKVNAGVLSGPIFANGPIPNDADYTIVFPATLSHPDLDINTIARDGNLLNQFAANKVYSNYAKFAPGSVFGARPELQAERPNPFWDTVETLIGAGPLLVRDGEPAVDFDREIFWESKIRTTATLRSIAGVKADGTLVFVTASGTVQELAQVMIRLGAVDATCLDGGGSSGMYLNGQLIRKPGRELSNILIFKYND